MHIIKKQLTRSIVNPERRVHTELCASTEFCAEHRNDLNLSAVYYSLGRNGTSNNCDLENRDFIVKHMGISCFTRTCFMDGALTVE